MEYRLLGQSDLEISRIGFGCMSLGEDEPANTRLLHTAIDKGINFFDTADLYGKGNNESMLGRALKEKRKDLVIASKVGNQWKEDGSGWTWNPRKEYILSAVNQSLKRLQTDYIDLYQLHGGTLQDNLDETIDAFNLLQQQGKIRYYGISSIRPNVIRAYAYRSSIVSVMMQYSLLDRRPEEAALDLLNDKHIGVLTRGSLASGLLLDKPAKDYLDFSADLVQEAKDIIEAAAGQRSKTAAALQFVLQHPAITSAVVGLRTAEQLNAAFEAMQHPALTENELQSIRQSIPLNYYKEHR